MAIRRYARRTALTLLLNGLRAEDLAVWPSFMAERLDYRIACVPLRDADARVTFDDRRILVASQSGGRRFADGFTARQRFSLAHELAHVLLARWPHAMPSHLVEAERICDFVASEILMPRSPVEEIVQRSNEGKDVLDGLVTLSQSAWVSRHAAAIRFRSFVPELRVA